MNLYPESLLIDFLASLIVPFFSYSSSLLTLLPQPWLSPCILRFSLSLSHLENKTIKNSTFALILPLGAVLSLEKWFGFSPSVHSSCCLFSPLWWVCVPTPLRLLSPGSAMTSKASSYITSPFHLYLIPPYF